MSSSFATGEAFVVMVLNGLLLLLLNGLVRAVVVVRVTVRRWRHDVRQTVKSFCGVEVELVTPDEVLQSEEALHFL